MNEITISYQEYMDLIKAKFEYDQLRNLIEKKLTDSGYIFSSDFELVGYLFGIEVKKDA